jgi:hypothetical protein
MTDSKAVRPGQFKKGDPRINKNGRKSKGAIAFGAAFARALANSGDAQALADLLWERALRGQPWAVDALLDRLIGKVTQPIDAEHNVLYRVIYEKPKDKDTPDANG